MKGFILAAGLGTRLRPWTLSHPKALVPVGGRPMLERVMEKLISAGCISLTVNVHHFASQIVEFIDSRRWPVPVNISDESDLLLDTGGALLHAAQYLCTDDSAVLVHNADILSDAPLSALAERHMATGAEATLLTSERGSSRQLCFDHFNQLKAWHNVTSDEWKPSGMTEVCRAELQPASFSGIHMISPSLIESMPRMGFAGKFSIIDFYLKAASEKKSIKQMHLPSLRLLDIGKPETLALSESMDIEEM